MIKKFNISKPEKYFKGQEEKTAWHNVGVMTEFHKEDGSVSRILEIPAIGLKANIFPFKEKEERGYEPDPRLPADEQVNPDDIPF